eukprot:gene2532-4932_t
MDDGELDLSNLPKDVEKLQLLVSDLSRRLQNSLHMIDAQKLLVSNATGTSDLLRARSSSLLNKLRLETSKNDTYNKLKLKTEESKRYDKLKKSAASMHEELRLAVLDHRMTSSSKESAKIVKIREKLESIESRQESQKQFLHQISIEEQMTEDLANACQHGKLQAARQILRKGANVNSLDSAGFLPIHYCCAGGFESLVRLLLEYGSDVSSYLSGYAPIVIASQNGHSNIVKILMEFGADVEEKGKGGYPAIVAAATNCHRDCVLTLVHYGADVNAVDLGGNTALHTLAKQSNPGAVIEFLLDCDGIDTALQNKQGSSPLQLALSVMNVGAIEPLSVERIKNSISAINVNTLRKTTDKLAAKTEPQADS